MRVSPAAASWNGSPWSGEDCLIALRSVRNSVEDVGDTVVGGNLGPEDFDRTSTFLAGVRTATLLERPLDIPGLPDGLSTKILSRSAGGSVSQVVSAAGGWSAGGGRSFSAPPRCSSSMAYCMSAAGFSGTTAISGSPPEPRSRGSRPVRKDAAS